jgi:iron complex outermembrane receptor protein
MAFSISRASVLLGSVCAVALSASSAYAQVRSFNIPGGELRKALDAYVRQSGAQLVYRTDDVSGVKTRGFQGALPPEEALKHLLAGTAFTVQRDASGAMAVVASSQTVSTARVTPIATSVMTAATATYAQAVSPATQPAVVEEVMVTGSRIVRDGYEAPTPTTVIGAADIQTRAPQNIADYVNQLPQLGAPTSPRTTLNSVTSTGGGANLLNARGLGATRTLVLLDGRRVVSAGLNNGVDVNLLPTNLVSRVDVVTGGASAAYGSDAVAGVINFVLDTNFTGLKGSVTAGVTDQKDAENYGANLALGAKFADGRGHILLSGQYQDAHGIEDLTTRSWYKHFRQISNPAFVAGGAQPANITGTDIGWSQMTQGGLINGCTTAANVAIANCALRGVNFGVGGTQLTPFVFGRQVGNLQQGGTFVDTADIWGLMPSLKNWNTFGRVSYDVTDNVTAYAEYSWGGSDSSNFSAPYYRFGDINIRNDNPYIPASVLTQMNTIGASAIQMGRLNYDLVQPGGHPTTVDYARRQNRFVAGLDGSFGKSGKFHTYYQRGESNVTYTWANVPIIANFNNAVDVIANPAVGGIAGIAAGTPICRSTLTSPNNGCVPVNLFGSGSPTLAAINYITGVTIGQQPRQDIKITQDVWSADAQYEPFNTWAGPVSVSGGMEYRKEAYTADADPISPNWYSNGFRASAGSYNVKEFFGETIVPLLRDAPFAKSLDFNGAARRTDYSLSGKVTTWKAGVTWAVNDDLILRGTRSRDIRAPNLGELFNGGQTTINNLIAPGNILVPTKQTGQGNPALKPEIAKTWTVGGSYRPSFAPGLGFSVDYYKIDVADAIVSLGAQAIINQCYGVGVTQNAAVCSSIIPEAGRASGDLTNALILTGGVNAQKQTVEGVDYEMSYRSDMERFFANVPGSIDFRALASQRLKSQTNLSGTITDNLGTTGDGPKWRANVSATYTLGPSRTTAVVRYLGAGKFNNWPLGNAQSIQGNHFDAVTYFDLTENYDINVDGHKVTLFGVVENIFDKNPPPVPGAFQNYGASSLHDLLGRLYRVGARFQF